MDTWNLCSIKRFDRRKESLNKLKFRAKNTGMNTMTTGGKAKPYMTNHAFAGSIPIPQSGATEIFLPGFMTNPHFEFIVDKMAE